MKEITINIANWGNVSDQEVLRAVRAVINNSVKYEQDRTIGRHIIDIEFGNIVAEGKYEFNAFAGRGSYEFKMI